MSERWYPLPQPSKDVKPISLAQVRAEAEFYRHADDGLVNRRALLALVEAVEAAHLYHDVPGREFSDACPLCRPLARFDFEERP